MGEDRPLLPEKFSVYDAVKRIQYIYELIQHVFAHSLLTGEDQYVSQFHKRLIVRIFPTVEPLP